MDNYQENWRTQIRKGYLELCILLLIHKHSRLYGFEILEKMLRFGLSMKEGTLYPLLNRMTTDHILTSVWETEEAKGHPRKFYSLTERGKLTLDDMLKEFDHLSNVYRELNSFTRTPLNKEMPNEHKPTT